MSRKSKGDALVSLENVQIILSYDRSEWALKSFEQYKATSAEEIFPAVVYQEGAELIIPRLVILFRGSL